MELSQEIIEANKFTPEQVAVVKTFGEDHIANIKKEYDTKANTNAEGILDGAVKYLQTKTGVNEPRQQGEKYADYITRISEKFLEGKSTELANAKAEYESKLKDFKGGDLLKSELDKAKKDYDEVLKKYADYEDIKKKAEQFDPLSQELSTLKIGTAFRDVKPAFPDTVNPYEAKAKWGEFEKKVLDKYNVEFVDGKPVAIDKDNKHRIVPLEDLVKADAEITALSTGRKQEGPNAQTGGTTVTIDGVPFPVPENCDTAERAKLIKDYLTKEGLDPASGEYSKRFAEYNNKIRNRGK